MASNGNCFICGKTVGKTAMKNHVLKEHSDGSEKCYLIKAEGSWNKDYWLLFSVPVNTSLAALDDFLRDIWCECCNHLSAFRIDRNELSMARKLSAFDVGTVLVYEYDFGTTTEIIVTFVDEIYRKKQREEVCLLARNVPPEEKCDKCGKPATWINIYEHEMLCDKCADDIGDDEVLLPEVNSPRSGDCGYEGELDIWTFNPKGPFPQPDKSKKKRETHRVYETEEIPAEEKWNMIDTQFQTMLINNVFCSNCHITTIVDYTIENSRNDIVLRGKCIKCGKDVARLIEFD